MSILKREVYYNTKGDFIRFLDWALTTTTLGVMAEPFTANSRHSNDTPTINFDATDMMTRIDELHQYDHGQDKLILSGGLHQLHGGDLMPRIGV